MKWLNTKYKISMFYMFIEVNKSVENIMKEHETIKIDHIYLKKDQIELLEMWNIAISIKKSMEEIRRLDIAEERIWPIAMRNYRGSIT